MNKFVDFVKSEYDLDTLRDIARYGADAGYHLITYNKDIVELHDKFENAIWDLVEELAENESTTVLGLMDRISSRKTGLHITRMTTLYCQLVWSAVEYAAYKILLEENDASVA